MGRRGPGFKEYRHGDPCMLRVGPILICVVVVHKVSCLACLEVGDPCFNTTFSSRAADLDVAAAFAAFCKMSELLKTTHRVSPAG